MTTLTSSTEPGLSQFPAFWPPTGTGQAESQLLCPGLVPWAVLIFSAPDVEQPIWPGLAASIRQAGRDRQQALRPYPGAVWVTKLWGLTGQSLDLRGSLKGACTGGHPTGQTGSQAAP